MEYKHVSAFFIAIFIFVAFGFVVAQEQDQNQDQNPSSRKIIVFKEGLSDADEARIIAGSRGTRLGRLRAGNLSVVQLDKAGEARIAKYQGVVRVEDDIVVDALETVNGNVQKAKAPIVPAQVLPWGIDRIDADRVWPTSETGAGVNVGVIDTGISISHPDLAANVKGGVSEVWYTSSYNDDNGHGSHVAGIIGALANTIGAVGGAPSVNVYAIKALDRNGSGYLSDVINGIDWAITHGMTVINLSLGTDVDVQSFHDAVIRAKSAGVIVVAAAGNSGGAVLYPAAYPEAIAVAATDISNTAPYWSSRGSEVDLAAPGVNVYSTYKGTKYATMSGTSMATPHVAASVALALKSASDSATDVLGNCIAVYDTNCDGAWSPDEIQYKLEATATDLGVPGQDDVYGWGLVNAYAAMQ
ncbi:S8 family peptidase [Candidatus Azambacteria bacterium]|nr:S8 family peptidase [Candidatus Azambacteria bacterium]MBI3685099.1 S8 family peptidase [Candidatus Azambacteria bacterium]